MSLRVCQGCSATYADGLPACPQCGTDDQENSYDWEEENMKTNAAGVSTLHLEEGQEAVDGVPEGVVLVGPGSDEPVDEEVATSAGSSSEASGSKTGKSGSSSSDSSSEPAPTTEHPSSGTRASDGAPTTGGSTQGTTTKKSTAASDNK